jgi:putative transposase
MAFCILFLQAVNGDFCQTIILVGKPFITISCAGKRTACDIGCTKRVRSGLRQKKGRHKHPTAGALDSQSVKTTSVPSSRGFDAGKKIQGRKRHILVDTLGLIMAVVVTTACVQDRDGLKKLLRLFGIHRKKLRKIWVDGGYRGQVIEWVKARFRYCLEVVLRSDDVKGFVVLPKRWIVERTFAWLNNHRRLSKDYERFTKTSETMIQIAMTRVMLRRLKPL